MIRFTALRLMTMNSPLVRERVRAHARTICHSVVSHKRPFVQLSRSMPVLCCLVCCLAILTFPMVGYDVDRLFIAVVRAAM
jgi:hypothetical protein